MKRSWNIKITKEHKEEAIDVWARRLQGEGEGLKMSD